MGFSRQCLKTNTKLLKSYRSKEQMKNQLENWPDFSSKKAPEHEQTVCLTSVDIWMIVSPYLHNHSAKNPGKSQRVEKGIPVVLELV